MNRKNIHRMWIALVLLVCVTAAAAFIAPGTLAYIQQQSNTLRNKFQFDVAQPDDITVPVNVQKIVQTLGETTIAPSGFSFTLKNLSTGESTHLVSDDLGQAGTVLSFTAQDAGRAYRYQLFENAQASEEITYSDRVYEIHIALSLDLHDRLQAQITVDGRSVDAISAQFINLYDPIDVPETGDPAAPMLYAALLLLSGAGMILLRKRRAQ